MMHNSTDTAAREQRVFAEARDAALWISDEELSIALRAAGASAEDVEQYLATDESFGVTH